MLNPGLVLWGSMKGLEFTYRRSLAIVLKNESFPLPSVAIFKPNFWRKINEYLQFDIQFAKYGALVSRQASDEPA